MSEEKSKAEPKSEPKPAAEAPLGDAGASGDPSVQSLLAHRAIAESNGDKDAVKQIDKELKELGVSV
jgi:hypothetical protein